jgi:hypothetical protein
MLCGGGKGFGTLLQLPGGRNQQTREVFDLQSPTGVAERAELESAKRFRQIFKVISSRKSLSKSPLENGHFVYYERPLPAGQARARSNTFLVGLHSTSCHVTHFIFAISRLSSATGDGYVPVHITKVIIDGTAYSPNVSS